MRALLAFLALAASVTCAVACDLSGMGGSSSAPSCTTYGGTSTTRDLDIEGAIKIDDRYGAIASSSKRATAGPFQLLIENGSVKIYDEATESMPDAGGAADAGIADGAIDGSWSMPRAGE